MSIIHMPALSHPRCGGFGDANSVGASRESRWSFSVLASEATGSQIALIDASIAAGVKRFKPSEFGTDLTNPQFIALPVCSYKAATQGVLQGWTPLEKRW